jgi:hypothetical protein
MWLNKHNALLREKKKLGIYSTSCMMAEGDADWKKRKHEREGSVEVGMESDVQ